MSPEDFRRFGHQLIDWLADFRAREAAGEPPVLSPASPGEIRAQIPAAPPAAAEPFAAVLADFVRVLPPGLTRWQHPRFFAYFPSNSDLASVLGDLASAALGQLGLNWRASPALTEVEEAMTDWMRQMLGLSAAWSGVIQDTASTSTLVALLCARERATRLSLDRGGLQAEPRPLTVYYSEQAHSSVSKAALLAGLGRENLRPLPVDAQYALRPDALAAALAADRARGALPCAVVATVGTTAVAALDPLAAIAAALHAPLTMDASAAARAPGDPPIWLHVDAAMAGAAMILPEWRPRWRGVEAADSLVVNAHKWLGANFDCSLFYVRDPAFLTRVLSTSPSYLRTAADAETKNYRDWGVPLGRRFRALKLWFLIREQGVEGLRARLRRDLANAAWLADEVRAAAPDWRLAAPPSLQTVCVLHQPPGLRAEALDRHTLAWVERVNLSGAAYLTPAQLDGRWMARVSVGGLATERDDVAAVWRAMRQAATRRD